MTSMTLMTGLQPEYQALRDTIRERGSLRVLVFVIGLSGWALAWAWLATSSFLPFISLMPLAVLVATFEAVFALHMGVERIGRYLEVFCADRWETTMTEFARRFAGGTDPLFSGVFATAVLLNVLPVGLIRLRSTEWLVLGLIHLAVLARLVRARRRSFEQRNTDLSAFLAIKRTQEPGTPDPSALGNGENQQ